MARKLDQGHKNLGEIIKMSIKGIITVHKKFAHNPHISKHILRNVIFNFYCGFLLTVRKFIDKYVLGVEN